MRAITNSELVIFELNMILIYEGGGYPRFHDLSCMTSQEASSQLGCSLARVILPTLVGVIPSSLSILSSGQTPLPLHGANYLGYSRSLNFQKAGKTRASPDLHHQNHLQSISHLHVEATTFQSPQSAKSNIAECQVEGLLFFQRRLSIIPRSIRTFPIHLQRSSSPARYLEFLCDMSAWFIIPERNLTYFTNLGKHDSDRVPHRKLTQYRKLPN